MKPPQAQQKNIKTSSNDGDSNLKLISTTKNNSNRETGSLTHEMNDFNSGTRNSVKSKAAEDEQKRSQSVKQMISTYQQQRLTIKEALCNLDKKPNNKIVFEEDNDMENEFEHVTTGASNKKPLFQEGDDSDEENFNFGSKIHFDSQEGQKLLELQSRFKGDKRFQLDERFLPDEKNSELCNVSKECSVEEEKKNEIDILEQVLGSKIKLRKQNLEQKCLRQKKMLRFDPSQSNHVQYEITAPSKPNKAKIKETDQNETEVLQQPHVSKDIFYQVHNDLKETLQSEQGFSLLKQFGKDENHESSSTEHYKESEEIIKNQIKLDFTANPFHYDSSEDEPDNLHQKDSVINLHESGNQDILKFHHEPFFFKEDDFRFQDGSDFITRVASARTAFVEQRRNLKHIIRAKVRNNNRKSNPFKKKLGGSKKKKLFRIKKALKR